MRPVAGAWAVAWSTHKGARVISWAQPGPGGIDLYYSKWPIRLSVAMLSREATQKNA
jgi:hypothetical protein